MEAAPGRKRLRKAEVAIAVPNTLCK